MRLVRCSTFRIVLESLTTILRAVVEVVTPESVVALPYHGKGVRRQVLSTYRIADALGLSETHLKGCS